jgi:hypothetical protein
MACMARFWACRAAERNQTTIGMVACTARSLAPPCHDPASDARLPESSSACVSSEMASASQAAAAWYIGPAPAPAIRRPVLISGGSAAYSIGTIAGMVVIVCWA